MYTVGILYLESIPIQLIKLDMHYPASQAQSPFLCLVQRLEMLSLQFFRAHTSGVSQKIYSKI